MMRQMSTLAATVHDRVGLVVDAAQVLAWPEMAVQ
jgi:hypothetical protein